MSKSLRDHVSDGFLWWGRAMFILAVAFVILPLLWMHDHWRKWRYKDDE